MTPGYLNIGVQLVVVERMCPVAARYVPNPVHQNP